jgi:hypothetical protein
MEEDNFSLRCHVVQLTIELDNMEENNCSLRSYELKPKIELEIGRRQLKPQNIHLLAFMVHSAQIHLNQGL